MRHASSAGPLPQIRRYVHESINAGTHIPTALSTKVQFDTVTLVIFVDAPTSKVRAAPPRMNDGEPTSNTTSKYQDTDFII